MPASWRSSPARLGHNPFYAGFPAHRFVTKRRGRVLLDRSEWVMPDERLTYPCRLTLPEWERLQHHIAARKLVGTPKTNKQAILTGVLCCSNGRFMTNRVNCYACTCRDYATRHKGMAIHEPKINKVGFDLVRQAVMALPEKLLDRRVAGSQGEADREYRVALSKFEEVRKLREDLILHAATHVKIYGQAAYEQVCLANRQQIDELEQRVAELEEVIHAPNLARLMPLLQSAHVMGFDAFWEAATVIEKRTMIAMVVARLVLVEPERRLVEEVVVEPQSWLGEYLALPERVRLPGRRLKS